jgi:hypothetical protein
MNAITQEAWSEVHQKACDIANASMMGDDVIAFLEAAFEDGEGERIEEVFLDGAFEGAGTEDGIEAGVRGGLGQARPSC